MTPAQHLLKLWLILLTSETKSNITCDIIHLSLSREDLALKILSFPVSHILITVHGEIMS